MSVDAIELSHSQYASRRKELLKLVKQLRSIGAQTELDLPRIAVIGNQSAGKSSVVEAISRIDVPRDAGTCTRCPMECRLSSSSEAWSCQVSIRWEFDASGKHADKVSEVPFGPLITDRTEVELALRRAYAETLRAGIHGPNRPLQFSQNVVCVDLEAPELTDLSFIDLPGIIQNAEPEVVRLVEDLVISHIKGNCLILVALPMTDDIENQKALRLARQVDPDGKRTIGVMTKPDMLSTGSTQARDLWLDVIEGRRHSLTHGYYCTRQPDDAERNAGITSANARQEESDYFSKTTPWSTSVHKHRFGTNNLVAMLSTLLVQIIKETLPNLRAETTKCLELCDAELSCLPDPVTTDPTTYTLNLVTSFVKDVECFVQGGPAAGRLIHENRKAFAIFKTDIRRTAPNFLPFPSVDQSASSFRNHLDENEDEGILLNGTQPFTLNDMRRHIEKSITRELPNNVPFQAKVALITSFQESWGASTSQCFADVRASMLQVLFECVQGKFGRYQDLQSHIWISINDLVGKHFTKCHEFVDAILAVEETPFTQNGHYLDTCKDKWLAKYKDTRAGRVEPSVEPPAQRTKNLEQIPGKAATKPANNVGAFGGTSASNSANTQASSQPPLFGFGTPTSQPGQKDPFGRPVQQAIGFSGQPWKDPHKSGRPFAFGQSSKTQTTAQPTAFALPPTSESILTPTPIPTPTPGVTAALAPASATSNTIASPAAPAPGPGVMTNDTPDVGKINAILGMLADIGYVGLSAEDLGKLNPPDEYETELYVMSEVRGYFQVAYKRVIDNVPSMIDYKFVKAITKELQNFLIAELGLGTADATEKCAKYLAEDPNVVARRDELVARKNRLESVKIELQNFGL